MHSLFTLMLEKHQQRARHATAARLHLSASQQQQKHIQETMLCYDVCTHLFHLIKSSSFIFFLSPNNIVPLSLWWKLNEGEEIYCFRYILCIHARLKRYYIISHKLSVPLGFGIFHLMSFD